EELEELRIDDEHGQPVTWHHILVIDHTVPEDGPEFYGELGPGLTRVLNEARAAIGGGEPDPNAERREGAITSLHTWLADAVSRREAAGRALVAAAQHVVDLVDLGLPPNGLPRGVDGVDLYARAIEFGEVVAAYAGPPRARDTETLRQFRSE